MKLLPAILVALGLLLLLPTMAAAQVSADDIAKQLVCQCGCNSVLNNCVHKECHSRDAMMSAIETQLSQGRSETQIIQAFVQQYGESVLSAPTKKGFNLTAWITPFVALVGGAIAIYLIVRKWALRGSRLPSTTIPQEVPGDEAYLRRVEEELSRYKGGPG